MFGLQRVDPEDVVLSPWSEDDDDIRHPDGNILSTEVPPGFQYLQDLGTGAFGEVTLAKSAQWGIVALKRTFDPRLELGSGHRLATDTAGEALALQAAASRHVLPLLGVVQQGNEQVLVLEHCATDLERLLVHANRPLPPHLAAAIFRQLLQAVTACHSAGVMHRDIKPRNILITKQGMVKLADFGHARWLSSKEPCSPAVASRWYRAPELLYSSSQYTAAVDIWALGCVLAELLGTGSLFPGCSDIDQLCRLRSVLGSIDPLRWPAARELPDFGKLAFAPAQAKPWAEVLPTAPPAALDLLQYMLQYNPDHRLDAARLLQHSFVQQQPAGDPGLASLVQQIR